MNAKKCKQIRKSLRANGVDWRDASYKVGRPTRFFSGHVVLDSDCGRAAYKWVKFGTNEAGATR
jgi:hypothetical protein